MAALAVAAVTFLGLAVFSESKCGGELKLEERAIKPADEMLKGLGYSDKELPMRRKIYDKVSAQVKAHNANKNRLWTAAVTEQALMTEGEKQALYGYMKTTGPKFASRGVSKKSATTPPEEWDWRSIRPSVVTPVKNQGHCGSCWAFASTAAIESVVALTTGLLFELSPQHITSCTPNPDECGGSGGCSGATAQLAFNYTVKAGISSAWTWPYESGTLTSSGTCYNNPTNYRPVAGITGYHQLPQNDAQALMEAVLLQPVSVSVAASDWSMYDHGIFDGCSVKNPILNHAVILNGYGSMCSDVFGTVHYWLVRNSWGPTWGEAGYIKIRRYPYGEPCGIDDKPLDGYSCKNNAPDEIKACGMCGILSDSAYPTGAYLGEPQAPSDPALDNNSLAQIKQHPPPGIPDGADGAAFMQRPRGVAFEL